MFQIRSSPAPVQGRFTSGIDADLERTRKRGRRPAAAVREYFVRTQAFGPLIVVAAVVAVNIGLSLGSFNGNPTGFVRFGSNLSGVTHPPASALVQSRTGYDGQYFWAIAQDPLLLHQQTIDALRTQAFRLQRVAYPGLAFVVSGGNRSALPWALLGLNCMFILAITAAFSAYAIRQGWSGWWGLAIGLLPGLKFALLGDMSDVLAVAALLSGLMLWRDRRRWAAAWLLAVAVLAREPMMLAPAAIALETSLDSWRSRHVPGALRRAWRTAWPPVVIPSVLFLLWQAYLTMRLGTSPTAPGTAYQRPVVGIVTEIHRALHGSVLVGGWDLVYLCLMVAAIVVALVGAWKRPTAASITAALVGISLLVLTFGSDWSYARLSAPMFAALLLSGLAQRRRPALFLCAAVAVLGAI
jgi:hypothetical protein